MENSIPSITNSLNCVECGACISICPTEAFELQNFKPTNFFFDFLEKSENSEAIISCDKNIPCLVAISSEYLVSSAIMLQKNIIFDIGHCESCEIFSHVGKQILETVEESNLILEALEQKSEIQTEKISSSDNQNLDKNRRNLIKNINLNNKTQEVSQQDLTQNIKNKEIPDKRKLFLTVLNKINISQNLNLESENISFSANKIVNESCTNCSICHRVCPTGALNSDYKNSFIGFNNSLCIKCALCSDVCETDSIFNSEVFNFNDFKDSNKRDNLINFNIAKCDECGNYFTIKNNKNLCFRCENEENEAKQLWSL
jgi:ferredoxin